MKGQSLPISLDEPALLAESIRKKAERTIDIPGDEKDNITCLLSALAAEMFDKGAPVEQSVARQCWGMSLTQPLPTGLFDAALLARTCNTQSFPALDFYYSRERDFAIAMWAKRWPERLLSNRTVLMSELELATQNSAGTEALRWFLLQQPDHLNHLRLATDCFTSYQDTTLKRVLLSSLCTSVSRGMPRESDWIEKVIDQAIQDAEVIVKIEAARLLVIFHGEDGDSDLLSSLLGNDAIVRGLLSIEEEYPLVKDSIGEVVLQAFQVYHDGNGCGEETSDVTDLLTELIEQGSTTVRKAASKVLGHISPKVFLRELVNRIIEDGLEDRFSETDHEYTEGLRTAIDQLQAFYYGYPLCGRGLVEAFEDEPEQGLQEYNEVFSIFMPLIRWCRCNEYGQALWDMLEDLRPKNVQPRTDYGDLLSRDYQPTLSCGELEAVKQRVLSGESPAEAVSFVLALRYQLPLPFDDLDISTVES